MKEPSDLGWIRNLEVLALTALAFLATWLTLTTDQVLKVLDIENELMLKC